MAIKQILIVENEWLIALYLKNNMEKLGYTVMEILSNYDDAINYVQSNENIDLIMMNIQLDGQKDGIDTITDIKKIKDIPFLYVTGYSDDLTISRASDTNPLGYWNKPLRPAQIKASIALVEHKIKTA